jgi:hypothetical protein
MAALVLGVDQLEFRNGRFGSRGTAARIDSDDLDIEAVIVTTVAARE